MPTRYLQVKHRVLRLAGARLVVLRGPDRGRATRLEKEITTVGTAASNDLVLTDDAVSQHHLSIRVLAGSYLATDLESTNGTIVAKHRIEALHLVPGDVIEIGETRVRLEEAPDATELPLSDATAFGRLIGRSADSRRLFAILETVARRDTTVLLVGETGTGKDLAAQAIHDGSTRADKPFVVVDCSAIPAGLMESELFGFERGAFTGAERRRDGALVEADGGTVFFDEIAKLPYDMQPKLLRALENREVRPLGSNKSVRFDVRVIAASDRDLGVAVNRGAFREDLFYRLNVIAVRMPPLRDRPDDIALLANHFYREFSQDEAAVLSPEKMKPLLHHAWPGNVRELRNAIEQMVALSELGDGAEGRLEPAEASLSYREARAKAQSAFERAFLWPLMARAEGNVSQAARLAKMDRVNLIKLLRKHGYNRPGAGEST